MRQQKKDALVDNKSEGPSSSGDLVSVRAEAVLDTIGVI